MFATSTRAFSSSKAASAAAKAVAMTSPYPGVAATGVAAAKIGAPEVTKLANGVTVVSVETSGPGLTVAAYTGAGSRFEDAHTAGASHFLRRLAWNSGTTGASGFRLTRTSELDGAQIHASSSREHFAVTVDTHTEGLGKALAAVANVVAGPAFQPWEVNDAAPFVELDLLEAQADPTNLVVEQAHRLAYRTGLGQPVLATENQIHHLNQSTIRSFVERHATPSRTTIVAVGAKHADVVALAQTTLGSWSAVAGSAAAVQSSPSVYRGNAEHRAEVTGASLTYAALVHQGASATNAGEFYAQAVARQILGTGPNVKYGGSAGRLHQAISKAGLKSPAAASAISASYSDAGLFGVYVVSAPGAAFGAISAAARELKRLSSEPVSAAELTRAKALAKAAFADAVESRHGLVEDLGRQSLAFGGKVVPLSQVLAGVDAVDAESASKFFKTALKTAPAYAVAGDISTAPWLDELTKA
ncbi:hypothetical protein CAOG_07363 [Capsaspora owczarzaki ATCC 30864]|uniref:Cytochrome b-c1 complex subunit 2, mitochondrial n=1 Tax=Capsaspora owczarzaki (strain ATCC 30864) TaxID=595528 RepID=A0A0D2X5B5_CAPO3|nr:hypothetical protein CAOG_07363 [Capsaspora owczarzaki ATCC 30864]KJE97519.1 hypothetical protein CAOG_007363 [Capsaspora owczarzaki ATCC 30864]|eukprot:XP_004343222.1 hypothetical protein CAOG_07363 [Capsaspora owczarzaki ATCC 30864]